MRRSARPAGVRWHRLGARLCRHGVRDRRRPATPGQRGAGGPRRRHPGGGRHLDGGRWPRRRDRLDVRAASFAMPWAARLPGRSAMTYSIIAGIRRPGSSAPRSSRAGSTSEPRWCGPSRGWASWRHRRSPSPATDRWVSPACAKGSGAGRPGGPPRRRRRSRAAAGGHRRCDRTIEAHTGARCVTQSAT